MIDLRLLAALAETQLSYHDMPVAKLRIRGRDIDTDSTPAIQAVVNLSPDSTYRTSVAPDPAAAIRKARIASAEGADLIDLGAESTSPGAARTRPDDQIAVLEPVVRELAASGIASSVESYHPAVIERLVAAGADVVNLTGSSDDDAVFRIAADAGSALILCYAPSGDVRRAARLPEADQELRTVADSLRPRLERALALGVKSVAVDPGIGFSYANLGDPLARVAAQSRYLLLGGALRRLGFPVVQSLPNAFTVFQEHYRSAEPYFAVLALLGRAGVLRVHEVGRVRAVREAMRVTIDAAPGRAG